MELVLADNNNSIKIAVIRYSNTLLPKAFAK